MSVSRLSRRGLLTGLGSVAGAAYVAACAGVGGPTPQKEVAPASLTFATFQLPPNAAGVAVEKAIRGFEARHPGVTATLEGLTNDQAQDLAKIQTLLAGGTVPDVALSRHHHLGYLASRGAFVPAEPRLQRDRRVTKADFFPVVADRLTWGGKMWGLPQDLQVQLSYYNLDLYARRTSARRTGRGPGSAGWRRHGVWRGRGRSTRRPSTAASPACGRSWSGPGGARSSTGQGTSACSTGPRRRTECSSAPT